MSMNEMALAIRAEVEAFAADNVAGRSDLAESAEFPWDVWQAMGRAGLFGIGLPEAYGGRGGGYRELAAAGEALVRGGGCLGLALSWVLEVIAGRYLILGFGREDQRAALLPGLASGTTVACLAMSEPGTGAHPKHMRTTACRRGDEYILTGEKSYLTNGPIADWFAVMAVTGEEAGKKRLTAFLVPADSPGLARTDPMDFGALRPSPHGGLRLTDVVVPAANMLGQEGRAYETMIKPFREVEDALLMGPVAGGLDRALIGAADRIRKAGGAPPEETASTLGEARTWIDTLKVMALEAAGMLDGDGPPPEFLSLLLAGRNLGRRVLSLIDGALSAAGADPGPELSRLLQDLAFAGRIALKVSLQKQAKLGNVLLAGPAADGPVG